MKYALTTMTHVEAVKASAFTSASGRAIFSIKGERGSEIAAHVPTHVATATAAAFNRAMEVKEADSGLVYTTDAGDWHISNPMPKLWHGQHDEITGDGDPSWMTVTAQSLEALQDAIDDVIEENSCTECKRVVGDDNVTELNRVDFLCNDCLAEAAELEAGLREMADDDKAHAQRELAQ